MDEYIHNSVKATVLKKMVQLARISTQPVKSNILQELEKYLPFENDSETQNMIIQALQSNKMNYSRYKVPSGLEEDAANMDNLVKWIEEGGGAI